jgi:hypothetical protein
MGAPSGIRHGNRDYLLAEQANRFHHLRVGHRAQLKIEHQLFDTDCGELLDQFDAVDGALHLTPNLPAT